MNRQIYPHRLLWFILLLITLQTGALPASAIKIPPGNTLRDKNKPLRLFIIGNSFSQNAARYLPQLVKENGGALIIGRAELGGCSLQRHWEIAAAYEADPNEPAGKQYKGKSLKMLLSEGQWDVVTIQQNSMNSSDVETYRPYARKLYDYIKAIQPQAEIVMHQTWAYRIDSKNFGLVQKEQHAQTQREMWEKSRAAYHTIADELKVRLMPVGDAFYQVSSNSKWGYQVDEKYDFANPVAPNLPNQSNSLHVGYTWKDNKLGFDSNHANAAGEFLGSLVWYASLFNQSPTKVKFVPEQVPADFAHYLKKVAKAEVKKAKKEAVKI
ncbi:DUF4886 domain-containing protein [Adhaeribacter aerolatus]|uniref:DUF4886 domain-containing protein n=1 Tax=Adhaeribacter aerolatus TaxID=670289 RepID=A0A512AY91_9BACT|nr:DUF4886 domain-containing protein [Adhaeribacter aerolatus]GEO04685.1 DUF4886 domain-containing protein [Adhaeribacter aerolatus]